jgi:YihY family inner membrane protein
VGGPGQWVQAVDSFQQRHDRLGFVVAVIKKYGDDRGGALAGLLTYYGFLAVFPLLLLLTTILGFVLGASSAASDRVLRSALIDFPIIGDELTTSIHPLRGSTPAMVFGLLGLAWGSLGVTQVAQHAMAEVWNIPGVRRPGFGTRLTRGVLLFLLIGLGVASTTLLAAVAAAGGHSLLVVTAGLGASAAINVALFIGAFRITTPKQIPTHQLLTGSVLAGIAWTILQTIGGLLVSHQLRHASQVYGFFGSVLGLISWLFLGAQLTLYCAELNVVRARRLWPRSIVQPPLTSADQRTLTAIALQGERRPEETVTVTFDEPDTPVR